MSENSPSAWDQIDRKALDFVRAADYELLWQFDRGEATEEVPSLTGEQLDASLRRLNEHRLIAAGNRTETIGYFVWSRLRLTADGWRVLGEWPPLGEANFAAVLAHLLGSLADQVGPEDAKPLRRSSGLVGRFASDVLLDVARTTARQTGEDLAS